MFKIEDIEVPSDLQGPKAVLDEWVSRMSAERTELLAALELANTRASDYERRFRGAAAEGRTAVAERDKWKHTADVLTKERDEAREELGRLGHKIRSVWKRLDLWIGEADDEGRSLAFVAAHDLVGTVVRYIREASENPLRIVCNDASRAHKGDPCIYCNRPHDDVGVGDCPAFHMADRIKQHLASELECWNREANRCDLAGMPHDIAMGRMVMCQEMIRFIDGLTGENKEADAPRGGIPLVAKHVGGDDK